MGEVSDAMDLVAYKIFFKYGVILLMTYESGGHRRQADFLMMKKVDRHFVRNVNIGDC